MILGRGAGGKMLTAPGAHPETRVTVLHLYILLVAARFIASLLLSEPVILSDELTYKSMASGFFSAQDFAALRPEAVGAPTNIPYILYPLVLSAVFFFGGNFLVAGKLLNALLVNAAIFSFFGILKDFLPRRRAVWAAALPLLLPAFGYSALLMAENIYLPLAAAAFYLLYRQFSRRNPADAVLSTVVLVLLFLSKHQAVAFLFAVPLAAAALISSGRARAADPGRARDILTGLGVMFLTALAAGGLVFLALPGSVRRVFATSWDVVRGVGLSLYRSLGGRAGGSDEFFRASAAHLGVILFLFLVPVLVTFWTWAGSLRSADRKSSVLSSLTLSMVLASFAMTLFATSSFSPLEEFARLHGRFYAAALPFLLVSFAACGRDVAWTRGRKTVLGAAAAATLAMAIWALPGFLTSPGKSALVVDFPELGWAAFSGWAVIAGAVVLFVLLVASVLVTGKPQGYVPFLLALLLVANVMQVWTFVRTFEPDRTASRPARAFVAGCIPGPEAKVAVFSRGELSRDLLVFWHSYRYTRSAEIPRDGVVRRDMIPAGTEFVVVFGEGRLAFEPARAAHQAGGSVFTLTERIDVLRDLVGVYHDAPGWTWTGRTFAYFPGGPFRTLVLTLNERRPYFSRFMDIETEQGTKRIRLTEETRRIELPYSTFYRFRLDRVFSPRRWGLNRQDTRALGVSLKEAYILF